MHLASLISRLFGSVWEHFNIRKIVDWLHSAVEGSIVTALIEGTISEVGEYRLLGDTFKKVKPVVHGIIKIILDGCAPHQASLDVLAKILKVVASTAFNCISHCFKKVEDHELISHVEKTRQIIQDQSENTTLRCQHAYLLSHDHETIKSQFRDPSEYLTTAVQRRLQKEKLVEDAIGFGLCVFVLVSVIIWLLIYLCMEGTFLYALIGAAVCGGISGWCTCIKCYPQ